LFWFKGAAVGLPATVPAWERPVLLSRLLAHGPAASRLSVCLRAGDRAFRFRLHGARQARAVRGLYAPPRLQARHRL